MLELNTFQDAFNEKPLVLLAPSETELNALAISEEPLTIEMSVLENEIGVSIKHFGILTAAETTLERHLSLDLESLSDTELMVEIKYLKVYIGELDLESMEGVKGVLIKTKKAIIALGKKIAELFDKFWKLFTKNSTKTHAKLEETAVLLEKFMDVDTYKNTLPDTIMLTPSAKTSIICDEAGYLDITKIKDALSIIPNYTRGFEGIVKEALSSEIINSGRTTAPVHLLQAAFPSVEEEGGKHAKYIGSFAAGSLHSVMVTVSTDNHNIRVIRRKGSKMNTKATMAPPLKEIAELARINADAFGAIESASSNGKAFGLKEDFIENSQLEEDPTGFMSKLINEQNMTLEVAKQSFIFYTDTVTAVQAMVLDVIKQSKK